MNEISIILSLLEQLSPDQTKAREEIDMNCKRLYKNAFPEAQESPGEAYHRMKATIRSDPAQKQELIGFLEGESAGVRSWAGAFIARLFDTKEAVSLLCKALEVEKNLKTASNISWELANIAQGNRTVCRSIKKAYDLALEKTNREHQVDIAASLGKAECDTAGKLLLNHLKTGSQYEKKKALDGYKNLIAAGKGEDDDIKEIWDTFLSSPSYHKITPICSQVLAVAKTRRHRSSVIKKFMGVISNRAFQKGHRDCAADALVLLSEEDSFPEELFENLIKALSFSDTEIISKVVIVLCNTYKDWESKVVDRIIGSQEEDFRKALSRSLAINSKSRRRAVDYMKSLGEDVPEVAQRVEEVLKEIGGEEAYESLQKVLERNYSRPSDELQQYSQGIYEETITLMKKNYNTGVFMNQVVFILGIVVIIVGIVIAITDSSNDRFFGTASVVSGLGTLVSLFFFGPLKRIQQAITELVQIEVTFVTFMHRIMQTRSIFERQYLAEAIDLDSLTKIDNLLNEGMVQTIGLLQNEAMVQEESEENKE